MGITTARAVGAGEGSWEACCVPQHLLAPFLLGLTSEDLTPANCGFWRSKGHVLCVLKEYPCGSGFAWI